MLQLRFTAMRMQHSLPAHGQKMQGKVETQTFSG